MRETFRGIGYLLHVPLSMALLSAVVCLLVNESEGILGFLLTALVSAVIGQGILLLTRKADHLQLRHALIVSAAGWLAVSAICTIPFLWTAFQTDAANVFLDPTNAFFESVSGITSTGLSVVTDVENLPQHLQWWRSLSEWVGGIGLVVLLLTVLPISHASLDLYHSEGRDQKLYPTVRSTVAAIWALFVLFTLVGAGALMLAGEPPWQAVNHAMAAISTGGFSITNDSVASASVNAKLVYIFLMTLGAMSFLVHYQLLRKGDWRAWLYKSSEIRGFWIILIGGSALLLLENNWANVDSGVVDTVFQWVSAVTTTGFSTQDLGLWSGPPLLLIIIAMLIGAMAGSTGSGIKVLRVMVLIRGLIWSIRSRGRAPGQLIRYDWGGIGLSQESANRLTRNALLLTLGYLLTWLVLSYALLHAAPIDTPLQSVFFEIASAQGNVGLSVGITSADLSAAGKLILCLAMYMGRLELVPVLVMLMTFLQFGLKAVRH